MKKEYIKKIKIELTREELMILIKATNWATQEYFKQADPKNTIKVSELNTKLNEVYNGTI